MKCSSQGIEPKVQGQNIYIICLVWLCGEVDTVNETFYSSKRTAKSNKLMKKSTYKTKRDSCGGSYIHTCSPMTWGRIFLLLFSRVANGHGQPCHVVACKKRLMFLFINGMSHHHHRHHHTVNNISLLPPSPPPLLLPLFVLTECTQSPCPTLKANSPRERTRATRSSWRRKPTKRLRKARDCQQCIGGCRGYRHGTRKRKD